MNNRIHKDQTALELPKILAMLAEHTCCPAAAERVRQIEPSTDCDAVRAEIARTDSALTLASRFGTPAFHRFADPSAALKRAQAGGMLHTAELLNVARVLRQARGLLSWFRQCESVETPLRPLFTALHPDGTLEKRISDAILSEEEIDDNASAELAHIRQKINRLKLNIRENLESMVRSAQFQKYLQEQIITMRAGRFVVPVKAECRSAVRGMVHDTSASGSTLFIEPASVVDANNEIRMLEIRERAEIERILLALSQACAEQSAEILDCFDGCIALNVYFAKASLAAEMNAFAPQVTDTGEVNLLKARHPLIDPERVVPVDVSLGVAYDTLVITGPNTGGKTVTLKLLGLFTLMTMCGLLIPAAAGSTVSVFERVLVDIGDEQSIEQNLSTFSSHITNIVSVLKDANARSLVLVDELGSGTDPVEGAALAIAVLEAFRRKGAKTAATTHYAELKVYALETERVENAACEFDLESLRPTYRLMIGTPGRSNAFAISRRLGLPEQVLADADALVSSENRQFESLVDRLEQTRKQYERSVQEANRLKNQIKRERHALEEEKRRLEQTRDRQLEDARASARRIVEDTRARAEQMLDELEEIRRQKDKADFSERTQQAKARLRGGMKKLYDEANPVDERRNDGYTLPRSLKVGDTVLVVDLDKKASVLELPDKSGNVYLQVGLMKMRTPLANLRLLKTEKISYSGKTVKTVKSRAERDASTELDLRGRMVEEALLELDQFIDNAVLSGVRVISIIHGKGTGALRRAVQQHLKSHKSIRSFRLGVYGEGEDGVTIAELK